MNRTELRRKNPMKRGGAIKPKRRPQKTAAEHRHMDEVAALGCLVCSREFGLWTHPELHHLRDGQGTGQRASHYQILPLCGHHHRTGPMGDALHAGTRAFEAKHGTEKQLLAIVMELLKKRKAA